QVLAAGIEPWSVNTPAQAAGLAALADAAHAARTLEYVRREREALFRGLAEIPGLSPFPSAANYLLVRLSPPLSAPLLADRLLAEERILIRDCSDFRGLGPSFIRLAVRTTGENLRLLGALRRVC
ncbi:MAG TPA: aminotransferase class I/II-fold pyridoxal phosphate-dependent enzyme, partial [Verrucomicrobiae bacterium]|nr:aminotransferase class I/II-fold pyridoxal phosphate-dependent enzyme [Verrucomicrobiae bacterium]